MSDEVADLLAAIANRYAEDFARWMVSKGYTNNPEITEHEAKLMAEAYLAGATTRTRR